VSRLVMAKSVPTGKDKRLLLLYCSVSGLYSVWRRDVNESNPGVFNEKEVSGHLCISVKEGWSFQYSRTPGPSVLGQLTLMRP
jgi:hypothetical protein